MPDRDLPRRARIGLRWLRALVYAGIAGAGISALVWAPGLVPGAPRWATWLWAVPTIVGGVGSCVGVAIDRYRVEWAVIWYAVGGMAACSVVCWQAVLGGAVRLLALALAVSALAGMLALRGEELRLRADRLRREGGA